MEATSLSQTGQSLQSVAVVEGEMLAGFVAQKRQVRILDDTHQLVAIHFRNSCRWQFGDRSLVQGIKGRWYAAERWNLLIQIGEFA